MLRLLPHAGFAWLQPQRSREPEDPTFWLKVETRGIPETLGLVRRLWSTVVFGTPTWFSASTRRVVLSTELVATRFNGPDPKPWVQCKPLLIGLKLQDPSCL